MRLIYLVVIFGLSFIFCNTSGGDIHIMPNVKDTSIHPPAKADTSDQQTLFHKLQMHLLHGDPSNTWKISNNLPLPGSILPYKRIVAYYGNFYSAGMGILGELPPDEMLLRLQKEAEEWSNADTMIPVQPAIHYIAVTAQNKGGPGGTYRSRMPFHQIDKAIELAKKIDAIVFLDIQVGHSTLQKEIPPLEFYLKMPNVHLAIDPEYSMKNGHIPGTAIGTFDATDINYASEYLSDLVRQNNLPPKVLVVHRFTRAMLTNYKKINIHPETQIVINMDGFGNARLKKSSYKTVVTNEPVQFAGFKLFYKVDTRAKPNKLMEKSEILALYPSPIYIQYQ